MEFTVSEMGSNVSLVCKDEKCSVYKVQDLSGEGVMTCYTVFPGIMLNYNDFHMERCSSQFKSDLPLFCINHCREGRIQWEFDKNHYTYIESGDMQINMQHMNAENFSFPLNHYHGLTVGIFPDIAQQALGNVLDGYNVDILKLVSSFSQITKPHIIRSRDGVARIFEELYNVPDAIREGYLKVKVLELLLQLCNMQPQPNLEERPYFHRRQVQVVKEIMRFITEDPQQHYTLQQLAEKFEISLTAMKQCFKAVYGTTIYSYMRSYRMNAAAVELRRGSKNIGQIAALMGYDNASKFSAAFKEVIGITPGEYRKSSV